MGVAQQKQFAQQKQQQQHFYLLSNGNFAAILLSSLGVVHILVEEKEKALQLFIEALKYNNNNAYIWNN